MQSYTTYLPMVAKEAQHPYICWGISGTSWLHVTSTGVRNLKGCPSWRLAANSTRRTSIDPTESFACNWFDVSLAPIDENLHLPM